MQVEKSRESVEAVQLTRGAIGCALSHAAIWKEAATHPDSFRVLVLEDDVILSEDFDKAVSDAILNVPDDFDMLYLSLNSATLLSPYSGLKHGNKRNTLAKVVGRNFQTPGYIITAKGAKRLLKQLFPLNMQIDSYIEMLTTSKIISAFAIIPPPVLTEARPGRPSDIQQYSPDQIDIFQKCNKGILKCETVFSNNLSNAPGAVSWQQLQKSHQTSGKSIPHLLHAQSAPFKDS